MPSSWILHVDGLEPPRMLIEVDDIDELRREIEDAREDDNRPLVAVRHRYVSSGGIAPYQTTTAYIDAHHVVALIPDTNAR